MDEISKPTSVTPSSTQCCHNFWIIISWSRTLQSSILRRRRFNNTPLLVWQENEYAEEEKDGPVPFLLYPLMKTTLNMGFCRGEIFPNPQPRYLLSGRKLISSGARLRRLLLLLFHSATLEKNSFGVLHKSDSEDRDKKGRLIRFWIL